jgi:hypothetical protein
LTTFSAASLALLLCSLAFAQDSKTASPAARPDDVKSVDAIVAALYDVISGPAGDRDWARFQSLCIPDARFIRNVPDEKGQVTPAVMTLAEFQQRASQIFQKENFYERGIHSRVDQFGTIAQVFTTYESSREKGGKPFERGINSMQFVYDGHRWWCATILWDNERPGNPIPRKYLK